MTTASPQKARRTQEERSAAMRARLLDATIESLIDLGYSATTTTVIAERAGASRGAQLHHFSTKAELVAAAVEHLAHKMGAEVQRVFANRGGALDASELIDALWASFRSPLFVAWLELSVAARTDEDLRRALSPVEGRLRNALTTWSADGFASDVIGSDVEIWLLTFYVLQGLALDRTVGSEAPRMRNEREKRALDAWKQLVADRLA